MMISLLGVVLGAYMVGETGVVEVDFAYSHKGNPYDARENDVWVEFERGGSRATRPAFFDGQRWRARLRTEVGTKFSYVVKVGSGVLPISGTGVAKSVPEPIGGVIRVVSGSKGKGIRPTFGDERGEKYFPIGCNLGWQNGGEPSIGEQFALMSQAGINWSRVWANHWDGKNPYWVSEASKIQQGWMYPGALDRWDEVLNAAARTGIRVQMVLFHHGPWSLDVNSNWGENPWNKANGGWLNEPREFFTDELSKAYCKNWLRYAVARYGYSGSVLSWELFNEVEWTQPARQDKNWDLVSSWHKEMAAYLRSVDRDRHMITSSSLEHEELFESLDYYQPHVYPSSVKGAMIAMKPRDNKPLFFGEFGPTGDNSHREALRDGLWESTLNGHAGSASYWYWDKLMSEKLYDEFRLFSDVVEGAAWLKGGAAKVVSPRVSTVERGDRVLTPGVGWGKTTMFDIDLTKGDGREEMGEVSGYFNSQTGGNRELFARPLTLTYESKVDSAMRLKIVEVGGGGASLRVSVDGKDIFDKSWTGGEKLTGDVVVPLPAGKHTVALTNGGDDWFRFSQISVIGIAPAVEVSAFGEPLAMMMRLSHSRQKLDQLVEISGLGLKDGTYRGEVFDLTLKTRRNARLEVKGGRFVGSLVMKNRDEVWLCSRVSKL